MYRQDGHTRIGTVQLWQDIDKTLRIIADMGGLLRQRRWTGCCCPDGETTSRWMENLAGGEDKPRHVIPARCGLYPFSRKVRPALSKTIVDAHLPNCDAVFRGGNYDY